MSKRSVINIHVGQCGIQVGIPVWELYCFEHDIQKDGTRTVMDPELLGSNLDNFRAMFYETANGKYVPKALFIDTEQAVNDALKESSIGGIVHPDFVISGKQDCRNIMGLAWYPTFVGSAYHAKVRKQIRRVREQCDSISGAIYYLSSCGGTGTGMTCRALETMRDSDPKSINYANVQMPSPTVTTNPLETYNTIGYMGISRFDSLHMNMHVIFDNEALYRQANKIHKKQFSPTYRHLNQLIALTVSSCSASLRFDGQLNVDLNEFQTNLVPIPTLNTCFQSFGPVLSDQSKESMTTRDITLQAFGPEAMQCSVDPFAFANKWLEEEQAETWPQAPWLQEADAIKRTIEQKNGIVNDSQWCMWHKFIGCCVMYRGDLMPATINRAMRSLNEMRNPQFVKWVPTGFKVGINSPPLRTPIDWPVRDMARSVTCIMNNTVIIEKLKQIVRQYRCCNEMSGYDVWVSVGGIESSLLQASMSGMVDQLSQYEFCMSTTVAIDEVKSKLEERPQPLGKF